MASDEALVKSIKCLGTAPKNNVDYLTCLVEVSYGFRSSFSEDILPGRD